MTMPALPMKARLQATSRALLAWRIIGTRRRRERFAERKGQAKTGVSPGRTGAGLTFASGFSSQKTSRILSSRSGSAPWVKLRLKPMIPAPLPSTQTFGRIAFAQSLSVAA